MTLSAILEELNSANHPVAKAIRKSEHYKMIAIGFKQGMVLKEHKAPDKALLVILSGKVEYKTNSRSVPLNTFDEWEIPLEEYHSVVALEDALCLLIVG